MKISSTPSDSNFHTPNHYKGRAGAAFWGAERLLLVCLLGLGLIGLIMTYSDRVTQGVGTSRVEKDSLNQQGKIQGDHMVLPLNQRRAVLNVAHSASQL